jgi:uncharacterized ferritin-like protein (DUF455 family)
MNTPDWSPFELTEKGTRSAPPRTIDTLEGVGDRLRAAAFAEIQAREAFRWAAGRFETAPMELRNLWRALADEEEKHMGWLLARMKDLNISVTERQVSDQLWVSLVACNTDREFALYMASAEERGRRAGERFYQTLLNVDSVTAEIFGKIAHEEIAHIELAKRFYPDAKVGIYAQMN